MTKEHKPNRKKLLKKLQEACKRAWSERAKQKAKGKCEYCGSTKRCSAHHVFAKKSHPSVRYAPDNAVWLCFYCHIIQIHKQGNQEIIREIEKKRPVGWFDNLRVKAKQGDDKHDFEKILQELTNPTTDTPPEASKPDS